MMRLGTPILRVLMAQLGDMALMSPLPAETLIRSLNPQICLERKNLGCWLVFGRRFLLLVVLFRAVCLSDQPQDLLRPLVESPRSHLPMLDGGI